MEQIKQEIEIENKIKKSKKQTKKLKNNECQIIDSDASDDEDDQQLDSNENIVISQENNENQESEDEEDSEDDEEEINLETFTCNQPGEYEGVTLLIEKKTNKIYEGDEYGILEIGEIEDGVITFNVNGDDDSEEDTE